MNYYMIRYECDSGCGSLEDLEPGMEPPDGWKCDDEGDYCPNCLIPEVDLDEEK